MSKLWGSHLYTIYYGIVVITNTKKEEAKQTASLGDELWALKVCSSEKKNDWFNREKYLQYRYFSLCSLISCFHKIWTVLRCSVQSFAFSLSFFLSLHQFLCKIGTKMLMKRKANLYFLSCSFPHLWVLRKSSFVLLQHYFNARGNSSWYFVQANFDFIVLNVFFCCREFIQKLCTIHQLRCWLFVQCRRCLWWALLFLFSLYFLFCFCFSTHTPSCSLSLSLYPSIPVSFFASTQLEGNTTTYIINVL